MKAKQFFLYFISLQTHSIWFQTHTIQFEIWIDFVFQLLEFHLKKKKYYMSCYSEE